MIEKKSIGIDIGGTNTKFGIVNKAGVIFYEKSISSRGYRDIHHFIDALYDVLKPEIDKYGFDNFEGIGIGAPNANYLSGAIEHAPNIEWQGVIPILRLVQDKFKIVTKLNNDANAAAIGEKIYGGAKKMSNFIMITLGTGVGGGIFVDGKLLNGSRGFGGEVGHIIIVPGGRMHTKTKIRGSLESYASATGVVITTKELLQEDKYKSSILHKYHPDELNSLHVDEALKKGDELAKEVFDFTAKILGTALANFVMITDPEAIFLFGGLAQAGNHLMRPTKKYMEESLIHVFRNKVSIHLSRLPETNAAILGASALVWNF